MSVRLICVLQHFATVRRRRTRTLYGLIWAAASGIAVAVALPHASNCASAAEPDDKQFMLAMLGHNELWLDHGDFGAGGKVPFDVLSYAFHTEREDVREQCVLDRDGQAAMEIVYDGQGKLKDRLGARHISLNSAEYATSRRGAKFAWLHSRSERSGKQPFDLALKRYASIGCQFDLPLFRYRERIESAQVAMVDAEWNGVACKAATVANLGRDFVLGCGTMFGFTSWSYMHDIRPTKEVLYIDAQRNVPLHETLISGDKTFEIDFLDYFEPTPGQFAPRSIRIESPGYFTCEYQFQIVAETHWMLKEVVSWFNPDNKSRGVVEDVQINAGRELLDASLAQVEAARKLFAGEGEPADGVALPSAPFRLGEEIRLGPYRLRFTLPKPRIVSVQVSTSDVDVPVQVPICIFDEQGGLLFAPTITLVDQDGKRQGQVELRGSRVWNEAWFVAVPGSNLRKDAGRRVEAAAFGFRWNESLAINVPGARNRHLRRDAGQGPQPNVLTRAFRVRVNRNQDGSARATVEMVSINGPKEFYLDLSLALVSRDHELLSSGSLATELRVESEPVEKPFEIDLGTVPADKEPAWLIVGVAPGNVTSAPMGTLWASFMLELPFDVETMLGASDENCWRAGLTDLGSWKTDNYILREFYEARDRRPGRASVTRLTLLAPHVDALRTIVRESREPDVIAAAVRLLAYSGADAPDELLQPLLKHPDAAVQDAAAVAITFRGSAEHFNRLAAILAREPPGRDATPGIRRAFSTLESDALIALFRQGSDAAIDILGNTLLDDLRNLKLAADAQQRESLQGRDDRIDSLCKLLGTARHPRSVRWLLAAVDLIEGRPELSAHFKQASLIEAVVRQEPQAQDRIAAEIESGSNASAWLYALRRMSPNPKYVAAVCKLLVRDDLTSEDALAGIAILRRVESPEALAGLQARYERLADESDLRERLALGEALAAKGDDRGLNEAFEALVRLERDADVPADVKELRAWTRTRDDLRRQAKRVASKISEQVLSDFLAHKASQATREEQRVILELLDTLAALPPNFVAVLQTWSTSPDDEIKESARRLLDGN